MNMCVSTYSRREKNIVTNFVKSVAANNADPLLNTNEC